MQKITTTTRKPINRFWSQWSPLNNISLINNDNNNSSMLNDKLIEQTNNNIGDGNISINLDESLNFSSSKRYNKLCANHYLL